MGATHSILQFFNKYFLLLIVDESNTTFMQFANQVWFGNTFNEIDL